MAIQVNITTQVNSKKIRRVTHNGREHIVLPSYTLPSNVIMNGGLYTEEEIDKHYRGLEDTLAPLGHPQVNGEYVSAFCAEAINAHHVGAWNRNVKKVGNRVYVEKWVDVEVAQRTEHGRELLERVADLEEGKDVPPIHTSVAAFLERQEPTPAQKESGAEWVAKIDAMDHDAILLHEVGAATPEQGVGLMVNADAAQPLQPNAGALEGESFREKEARLASAAKTRFTIDTDSYVWIADFTDSQAVVGVNGETFLYGYTDEGGKITFSDSGTKVERRESWAVMAANKVKSFFKPQARPVTQQKEDDMSLTPEEKADLIKDFSNIIVTEVVQPIGERIAALEANQKAMQESLTANQKAEEASKRAAVAEVMGELIANQLSGEALDDAFDRVSRGEELAPNHASSRKDEPNFDQVPD